MVSRTETWRLRLKCLRRDRPNRSGVGCDEGRVLRGHVGQSVKARPNRARSDPSNRRSSQRRRRKCPSLVVEQDLIPTTFGMKPPLGSKACASL